MERTCARAVAIGLPSIAFTEHADYTSWPVANALPDSDDIPNALADADGVFTPPELDVDGYLESIERCRGKFPELHILSGLELGEPHWHSAAASKLVQTGRFDRLLGSLHCLPSGQEFFDIADVYRQLPATDVVREYLAEVPDLIEGFAEFSVLAHIDYPLRSWPQEAEPFDPEAFECEFRQALRVLAASGRALEINTDGKLRPQIVKWWHDEGGAAVSFGSDAHEPDRVANQFREASAMAEASGFRPGHDPYGLWTRTRAL